MPLTYIDIFAGAGGLSEGFVRNGHIPVAHVEMKREACFTLKTRNCYYYLKNNNRLEDYHRYLRKEISRDELYAMVPHDILDTVIHETMNTNGMSALFAKIDALMDIQGVKNIDVLVGGPPCQAYSLVGRARSENNMKGDARNYLYQLYADVLEHYHPRMFVFENVLGLKSANNGAYLADMTERFCQAGYDLDMRVLTASNYGVLQNRKRIILIGKQHKEGVKFEYPDIPEVGEEFNNYVVDDLLKDLPALQPGQANNQYAHNITDYLYESGIRSENDILTWHEVRPTREQDREIYRHAINAWYQNDERRRLRYTDLPENLCTHKNRTAFLDRFKVVAGNIHTSQTMVAHISKDGHYFIHPSLEQARSLSVREAARIQSFPDNYYFEGGRTAALLQIGNAVPPLMASAIANAVAEMLEGEKHG